MRLPLAAGLATAAVSITLYPLFAGGTWFWAGLGCVIVVTGVGLLASRFAVDRRLVPITQLVVLGWFLTITFAADETWWRVVPTKDAVALLGHLLADGFSAIQRYAAPVPDQAGISLLAAGGIGIVAILVDLCAVRLRRAALAGLPLLALFSVPASVLTDPLAWPAAIIGALGYIGLLLADGRERIGQWGRPVLVRRVARSGGGQGYGGRVIRPDNEQFRLSGKRIGFTAVALAIAVPALIPTLQPHPLFGFGVGDGKGKGGNTITIPNPVAGLRGQLSQQQNVPVLRYTSSDRAPHYMRLWALDRFDGQEWSMTAPKGRPEDRVSEGPLPAPPGATLDATSVMVRTQVTMSDDIGRLNFLPVPYAPSQIEIDGDWRADRDSLMVFSTRDEARGKRYTTVSLEPEPEPATLDTAQAPPAAITERYLRLPRDLPKQITALTRVVVKGAHSPYDKAVKLQEWFTKDGGFTYSLATKGQSSSALVDFLIREKTGYCEQFAASMAIMARILGIPSRVAIGYTGGTPVRNGFEVRSHDSHAWPELYFQGAGWVRFEPTPAGSLGQGTAQVPGYTRPPAPTTDDDDGSGAADSSAAPDSAGAGDAAERNRGNPRLNDPDKGLAPIVTDESMPLPVKIGIAAGVLLLIALIPAAWRVGTRLRRRRLLRGAATGAGGVTVHTAWAELCDLLTDLGLAPDTGESPRALARRLTERFELGTDAAAGVTRIAIAEERLRYAPTPGADGPSHADLRLLRRELAATVSLGRRIRAVLAPPSALARVRGLGGKILDGFDLLENLRLRRPHRPHEPAADDRELVDSPR